MVVSLGGAEIWRPEANKNVCHQVLLYKASSRLLRAHINTYVSTYFLEGLFRLQNLSG